MEMKMESFKHILFVLIFLAMAFVFVACDNEQKTLTDLRQFKVEGVAGRFTVDRCTLEKEIQTRKLQDAVCGQDVKLQLPKSLPHASYDTSHQGEVTLVDLIISDHTLADELSNELKGQVATSYRLIAVVIPSVFGVNEKHGVLSSYMFSNSTKKVIPSYITNYKAITQVDIVEEDGTVRIQLGDDVMVYQVQEKIRCKGKSFVGEDFDKVLGKVITATNYPLPFNWGCELLGSQISFCKALQKVGCELTAAGGDVCALTSTNSSQRCPITMTIVNMTGIFLDMFPFWAKRVPTESFEAEFGTREHTTGITFPCLTR